jgi:Helix-turn-helix domain/RodZ C-terminal domain
MFEIGGSLRTAREHRQLQLAEVEQATHIRAKYLAALEEERFDVLPGTAYAKGFLRTYADFLELDGPRFVDEFNERFAPDELPEASPPVRVPTSRRLLSARLVAIPVVVGIGLLVWRLSSGGGNAQHQAAVAPPVTHVLATTAQAPPAQAPPPTRAAPKPKRAQLGFVATRGPCWLSVRLGSSSGRVLYERTLQPGQRAQFAGAHLWIRIGAPWNLDASLNGTRVQLPTSVANVVVTPSRLRSTA